jgi:uncharacterized repeat protein (TIGR04138 family)
LGYQDTFIETLEKILDGDPRYKIEAYNFVLNALSYTQRRLKRKGHVTGQELLEGIREYAIEEYGPMVRAVFEHWGVRNTEDFGNIVFNLVNVGLMGKTEKDSLEDFQDGYDFKEVFG